MTSGKSDIVFRKTKGNLTECDPESWDDNALVRAYDTAVLKLEKVEMPNTEESSQTSDNDCTAADDSHIGEVVWSRTLDIRANPPEKKKKGKSKKKKRKRKQSPENRKPISTSWQVGDECMALYDMDNLYYPAAVVSIGNDGSVVVNFSEYDEEATMDIGDIHPRSLWENAGIDVTMQNEVEPEEKQTHCKHPIDNVNHSNHPAFPVPDMNNFKLPFIPPPINPDISDINATANEECSGQKDSLSAMLVSWYMAGYHTGYYRGLNSSVAKQNSKKS